jgi:hypothetical protein
VAEEMEDVRVGYGDGSCLKWMITRAHKRLFTQRSDGFFRRMLDDAGFNSRRLRKRGRGMLKQMPKTERPHDEAR